MAKKSRIRVSNYIWALARVSLGFTFLWAFVDKLFGLGYATCSTGGVGCSSAWIAGGSPTTGFLSHVDGPFASFYNAMSGSPLADWLFMLGFLGIGLGLTLGIAMRITALSGALLLVMMWAASLWLSNNPIIDSHVIYALLILGLLSVNKDQVWGLRKAWINLPVVKKISWLE